MRFTAALGYGVLVAEVRVQAPRDQLAHHAERRVWARPLHRLEVAIRRCTVPNRRAAT